MLTDIFFVLIIRFHVMAFVPEKRRTKDKLKIPTIHKLNRTQKKQTTQNTAKQNYPGWVSRFLRHSVMKRGYYNSPEHTRDFHIRRE